MRKNQQLVIAGKFGGVADTDCERLTEYGIETAPLPSRW